LANNIFVSNEQQEYLDNINNKVDDYNKFKLNNLKKKQAKGKCLSKKYKPLEYFNKDHKYIPYDFLDYLMKNTDCFKDLGSNSSQQTLRVLNKNWVSFFEGIQKWQVNPNKLLGRPKLPKYKKKIGRFPLYLCNNQFKVKDGYIYFCWKSLKQFNNIFKVNIPKNSKLIQLRFIPRNNVYNMELVYEKEISDLKVINNQPNRIVGIDLGVNNFATLTNNIGIKPIIINGKIIKSINQFYNKKLAYYKSTLKKINNKDWSNKLDGLTVKRNNKIKYYMHCASKDIIEYCISNNIDTIVIGKNDEWKQNSSMSKKVNQHFVQLPYKIFIKMIQYKAEEVGIKVILINESYTSGTSFLDGEQPIKENYNYSRRIVRGLFKSNSGKLINSDVNGSLQIIKKAISNALEGYGIEGLDLTPLVICA
jgi:putative transposase